MTVPERLIEDINLLVRTSRRFFVEAGREPSPAELAARLEMPSSKVKKLLAIARSPAGALTQPG